MAERSFLNDILRRVAFSPRSESRKGQSLAAMCRALMTERSEASGLVLATTHWQPPSRPGRRAITTPRARFISLPNRARKS